MVAVRVPNRFMLDWIRTQYSARLEAILSELQPGEVRMAYRSDERRFYEQERVA